MPKKSLKEINAEKKFVLEEIKKSQNKPKITSIEGKRNFNKFVSYSRNYNFTPEQRKDTGLAERVKEDYISYLNDCKGKMDHIYTAVSLYKCAKVEHDKLMQRSKVSNTLKQVSKNNLKDIENAIIESGVDKTLFKLLAASSNPIVQLKKVYAQEMYDHCQKTAEKYNVTTTMDMETAKSLTSEYIPPQYSFSALETTPDKANILQAYKGENPYYFDGVPFSQFNYPYDDEIGFSYHKIVDGKFVETDPPKGFWAKVGFYLGKWFGSEYKNEKKYIESEQKALENASEYAKSTDELLGDFSKYEEKVEEKNAANEALQNDLESTMEHDKKIFNEILMEEQEEINKQYAHIKEIDASDLDESETYVNKNEIKDEDIVGPGLEQVD